MVFFLVFTFLYFLAPFTLYATRYFFARFALFHLMVRVADFRVLVLLDTLMELLLTAAGFLVAALTSIKDMESINDSIKVNSTKCFAFFLMI